MILLENGLIRLDYNPANDLLIMEWPSLQPYALPEMRHSITKLIEIVRYYDIKLLLVDSRKSLVEVNDTDYLKLVADFARSMMETRLRKMARIITSDPTRESQIIQIKEETQPTFLFQNFSEREVAIDWLTQ